MCVRALRMRKMLPFVYQSAPFLNRYLSLSTSTAPAAAADRCLEQGQSKSPHVIKLQFISYA